MSRAITRQFRLRSPTPATLTRAAILATLALFIHAYLRDPSRRAAAIPARTWWAWNDQGKYYQDTLAWAAGNLAPSQHYYLPGYALTAAPFVHLTPLNPFLIPNLISIAATSWLLALIAQKLAPDRRWIAPLAAWAFFATLAWREDAIAVWIDPWDTTPVVPLCLWVILAALRFDEKPVLARAFMAGLPAGLILAFRPTEAAIYGGCGAVFCAASLIRTRPRGAVTLVLAAGLGAGAGLAPGAIAYVATHGFAPSAYLLVSRGIGFDPRLLPFQWVTIMLAPGPILAPHPALIPLYPWLVTGTAGILAAAAASRAPGAAQKHLLTGGAALANLVVFLCYRDLHSVSLFRYGNQHYFKGVCALMALYTVILAHQFFQTGRAKLICLAALLLTATSLPWRIGFTPDPQATPIRQGDEILLPGGLKGISYTLLATLTAPPPDYDTGAFTLTVGHQTLLPTLDYRIIPGQHGFILHLVRQPPPGPAALDIPKTYQLASQPVRAGWLTAGARL